MVVEEICEILLSFQNAMDRKRDLAQSKLNLDGEFILHAFLLVSERIVIGNASRDLNLGVMWCIVAK